MKWKMLGILVAVALSVSAVCAADAQAQPDLPKVDGKEADLTKPVKVFIILGQSNAVGLGAITSSGKKENPNCLEKVVKEGKQYPFLLDDTGNWAERKDVRNVFLLFDKGTTTTLIHNEWLKVGEGQSDRNKQNLGVEYSIGHLLGNQYPDPVMLLKCCNGNRGIGYELLPPGSKGFEFVIKDKKTGQESTYTYAGYHESPMRWVKGTKPEPDKAPGHEFAGQQYDADIGNAKKVLADLNTYYPGAKGYEVAGIFFWQGEKDAGDPGCSAHYEENLVHFIKSVRKDLNAPQAKFVLATLGEHTKESDSGVFKGHMAVDGASGKYPEFKGNVATVYTHDMARGGSGNGHYGQDSRVYMDIGLAMGKAMLELLKEEQAK